MKKTALMIAATLLLSTPALADRDSAIAALKQESKIVDAWWPNPKSPRLNISMNNNGTDRSGFAEYVCLILRDHDVHPAKPAEFLLIEIRDAALWQAAQHPEKIGMAVCSK